MLCLIVWENDDDDFEENGITVSDHDIAESENEEDSIVLENLMNGDVVKIISGDRIGSLAVV